MKAKFKLQIQKMDRIDVPAGDPTVDITASGGGSVLEQIHTAKGAGAKILIKLRSLVADRLEFGQTLYVTISTEPDPEGGSS